MTKPANRQAPIRVILVDDSSLFRQGLSALLTAAGLAVVAELSDTVPLTQTVQRHDPRVVILDARMPPTHTDEGIRAALQLRQQHADLGLLVLSTYAEGTWATQLFAAGTRSMGYLLKDRVNDTAALIEAIHSVAIGGTVIDPEVIERLLAVTTRRSVLDDLSAREQDVLRLMAEGKSNIGLGQALHLSPRTIEAYIASIFTKLNLDADDGTANRRVQAVLTFLQQGPT